MMEIIDTLVVILFILFLIFIFRGYHLSRLERDKSEDESSSTGNDQKNERTGD